MIDRYVIIVKVIDGGDLVLVGFIIVMVNVIDKNDNLFVFNVFFLKFVIFEVIVILFFVIQIIVFDVDFGSNVRIFYRIIFGNDMFVFVIVFDFGIIRINVKFDREIVLYYVLICEVIDYGQLQRILMLIIVYVMVLDVNDNVFIFGQFVFVVNVIEDVIFGIVVQEMYVVDNDVGFNGVVIYSIIVGNNDGFFDIGNGMGKCCQ